MNDPSFLRAACLAGAAVLPATLLPAGQAAAQTVATFNDIAPYTSAYSPATIDDHGLMFATGYYEAVYPASGEQGAGDGTRVLVNGYSALTITAVNGGDFLFDSLEYGQSFFTNPTDPLTITLNLAAGGTEVFDEISTDSFQTLTADVMVSSVVVGENSGYVAIDNVTYGKASSVSEPGGIAVFGVGLAGLLLTRRRVSSRKAVLA